MELAGSEKRYDMEKNMEPSTTKENKVNYIERFVE